MKLLTLFVGESGCGKSTLTDRLMASFKGYYNKVLSTVSREKREGERNGQDYFFSDRNTIETLNEKKQLVQLTEFGGNYYGTRESDYLGANPISVLSVVPEHVMTVVNHFKQPMFARDLQFQVIFFNSTNDLLARHLGDGWEERVKRGQIRERFMELAPHIKHHTPIEYIDDYMVNEGLHRLMHSFLSTKLLSKNHKFLVEPNGGGVKLCSNPTLEDFEGSMSGETSIISLEGCKEVRVHLPEKGGVWERLD